MAESAEHHDSSKQNPPKTIDSSELFQGARTVLIRHDGQVYMLRITGRNKLILQK
jgi:hemin uptake protein HemP